MSSATSAAAAHRLNLIIEATRRLFAQYGYRRTGLDDIAREAGVAKRTIYLQFDGKEDGFRAMTSRFREVVEQKCA